MALTPAAPSILRPRTADIVLYLDLDGVIQHEAVMWHARRGIYMSPTEAPGRTLFEWLPYLEELLAPFPQVGLVLSSTWCIRPGYGKTLKYLPETLRSRFLGGTFHRRIHGADPRSLESFKAMARGMQIWTDVQRRHPRQWLALDDDTEGWLEWARGNLVACDGSTSLSCSRVSAELSEKLGLSVEALGREVLRESDAAQHPIAMGGISPQMKDIAQSRPVNSERR